MSDKSSRIVISCLIIGLISCFCVTALGAIGLAVFWLSPSEVVSIISPEASPTPTARVGSPTSPVPTVPSTPDPALPAPVETDPAPPQLPDTRIPAEVANQMAEIETQVVNIRGLEALEPVDRYLMTPDELREHVMNDFLADYTEEDARDDGIELSAFGLLEPDYDLYTLYLDLYSEQIAGFYDHEVKAMYVIQGGDFRGPQRMTYAHEFVHALQDQHYDLDEGMDYNDEACEADSERCSAIQALVEGDASFTETQWFFSYSSQQDRRDIQEYYNSYSSPVFDTAPQFMRESLIFPYLAGQEFVEYLYDKGGWEAINEAYRNPPVSTSQILHPQFYPDKQPVILEMPDFLPQLGEDWREISRNVVGEYYTYLILGHGVDPQAQLREVDARRAAAGWAGDVYVVYHNDTTGATILVLQTLWDTRTEANEFVEAFRQYAQARFGSPTASQEGQTSWQVGSQYHQLVLEQELTTWIMAPNAETAEQIHSLMNP